MSIFRKTIAAVLLTATVAWGQLSDPFWSPFGNYFGEIGVPAVLGTIDDTNISMIQGNSEFLLRTNLSFELFWNGVQAMSLPNAGSSRTVNFVADLSDPAANANMQLEGGSIGETHYQVSKNASGVSRWGWTTTGLTFAHTHITFNGGGNTGPLTFEDDDNLTEWVRIETDGKVGIGDSSPVSLFTVGSGDLFQVNSAGNLVAIRGVPLSWPAANAAGVLNNNGSGTLSWVANGATGGGLPAGTLNHTLRHNGTSWIDTDVLQVDTLVAYLPNGGLSVGGPAGVFPPGNVTVSNDNGVTTGSPVGMNLESFYSGGIAGSVFAYDRILGTRASPAVVGNGRILGTTIWRGYDGTALTTLGEGAAIEIYATQTWNSTNHGTQMSFFSTNQSTAGVAEKLRFDNAGQVVVLGGPGTTGTDAAILEIRSGNSGSTAATIQLDRNGTDLSQWLTDGTDTFFDYTGILTYRSGIAGSTRATLSAAGDFTAVGASHVFGTVGTTTTFTIGQGAGGSDSATARISAGASGGANLFFARNGADVAYFSVNAAGTQIMLKGTLTWQDASALTIATLTQTGATTWNGATHVFGVAGTSTTLTVGQGTTGTDTAKIVARSGNSGTTAPTFALNRNGTDIAQLTFNGTDTFEDYTGILTFRAGIAGTTVATLGATGNLTANGTVHQFGINGQNTTLTVGAGTGGANADVARIVAVGGNNGGLGGTVSFDLYLDGSLVSRWEAANFGLTVFNYNGAWIMRDLASGPTTTRFQFSSVGTTGATFSLGAGGTTTNLASMTLNGGNSGTTAVSVILARNSVSFAQLTINGTDTFVDYGGILTFRSGIAGSTRVSFSAAGDLTAVGATHLFGTAGTAQTATFGQGTTGTDASKVVARSGNSGTTAPTFALNRNGTDIAQWTFNGTDTFNDYTGTLTWRTGIAGTTRMSLSAGGFLSVLQGTGSAEVFRVATQATNDDPNERIFQDRTTTAGAASANVITFATTSGEVYLLEMRGLGKCTSGSGCTAGNTIACVRYALYRNVGGTVTEVNETADYTAADGDMGGSCSMSVSTTNILFTVTGAANENITWHTTVHLHSFGT